jgi:hypothetical protein
MTRKKAAAKLKAMDDAIEIALNDWIEAGEDLEAAKDKRDRFFKRYKNFLKLSKKARIKKYAESSLL